MATIWYQKGQVEAWICKLSLITVVALLLGRGKRRGEEQGSNPWFLAILLRSHAFPLALDPHVGSCKDLEMRCV